MAGEMEDESGPAVAKLLTDSGYDVGGTAVTLDEVPEIQFQIERAETDGFDLIVTTGGTGLAARDVTPQATEPLLDYQVPGIAEAMRRAGSDATPTAILSRGLAGVRGHSLLVNLPGSRRGALESLNAVLPALGHGIALLRGEAVH
jgi:molybdenum cofactor synthesis domain-containing protein